MQVDINLIIAVLGGCLSAATFFIGRQTASRSDGERAGVVAANLECIKESVARIERKLNEDVRDLTDRMDNPARLMFCVSRDDLYKVRTGDRRSEEILRSLLRLYNGIFTEFRAIDEGEIAAASGRTEQEVHDFLRTLWRMHVIRYVPANSSPMIYFDEERLPTKDLYIAPETYSRRKELMQERFNNMLAYAGNTDECRSTVLRRYFGDEEAEPCGICDICLSKRRRTGDSAGLESKICLLAAGGELSVKDIVARIEGNPDEALAAIKRLLANGSIRMSDDGTVSVPKR